ncbi:hypothetical protein ACYX7E_01455 [Luteimonas sp. RIT-PG2_3]
MTILGLLARRPEAWRQDTPPRASPDTEASIPTPAPTPAPSCHEAGPGQDRTLKKPGRRRRSIDEARGDDTHEQP